MKSSGLGMAVYVDGYEISNDVQSIGRIGGGPAVLETTGVDKSAFERIGGRRDGAIDLTVYFNPETAADDPGVTEDRAHLVLKSLPTADRLVSVAHPASGEAWNLMAKQINYDPTVAADGMLTLAVSAQGSGYGLEPAKLLTAGKATQSGAGNLASVDFGAGFAFGAQFHLHVIAFTGTSATIKVQQSSDNGAGDAFADVTGGTFAAVNARGTQRLETARDQAVERYLRVATTGTFSELVFVVTAEVNQTETVF
jgi:hypothetical protein